MKNHLAVLAIAAGLGTVVADASEVDLQPGLEALNERKFVEAAAVFKEGWEAGDADGLFYIGRMQELGLGTPADISKAVAVYRKASDEGSAQAANRLGLLHLDGNGVLQDYAEARKLVCAAAEQGLASGQFNCGVLHA